MDTVTQSPVPDDSTQPEKRRPRRRGVLGLPARLALLVLAVLAVFVASLVVYTDTQVQSSRAQQAGDAAIAASRDFSAQMVESDLATGGKDLPELLRSRLEQAVSNDPYIEGLAVFVPAKNDAKVRVFSSSGKLDKFAAKTLAKEAMQTGNESWSTANSVAQGAWPLEFADGKLGAVIVTAYRSDVIGAAAQKERMQLILGALIGGSLLAAVILLLLRRELFRPLEELRRVMTHIGSGAKGVRIGWKRTDELGMVARDFDEMVDRLEAAQSELAQYVHTDPLTGLLNREAFTDRFAAELTRARREGYPITLVAIDIDNLDEVNQTHDRAAGDQVLSDIGSVIGGCTRPTDACGRTGDDSFHVALVGAQASKAAVVIDRIRREIAQRVGIGPERTRVTCGFGVAEFPQHAVDQIALERMADSACKHAQRDGRDRALAFGPSGGYVDAMSLAPEDQVSGDKPAGAHELATTVHALARALDGIDPALGGSAHSQRVARYAAALARELGFGDSELRELRSAAVLHDVGKVAVPLELLRMPEDKLDERQRSMYRYHAWVSRTMISGAGLASVANIVFHIPERWDGKGYPERLREEAIPQASRILRAAEVLDDLTSGTLSDPVDPFRASAELKRRAGEDLDPDIAVMLARLVRDEGLVGNIPAAFPSEGDEAAAA